MSTGEQINTVEQAGRSLSTLLTRADVAELMQVSEHTVDRWCREGRLPRIRVARAVRFRAEDVGALIDGAESLISA
jgi:excisionase family DNA binding protein